MDLNNLTPEQKQELATAMLGDRGERSFPHLSAAMQEIGREIRAEREEDKKRQEVVQIAQEIWDRIGGDVGQTREIAAILIESAELAEKIDSLRAGDGGVGEG